jgi:phosphoserine phosphatase
VALTLVGTRKSDHVDEPAIRLVLDGKELAISQATVDGLSEAQVTAAIEAAASLSSVALPAIAVHRNRDGSLAIATGTLPKEFTWPEDEEGEAEIGG